MQQNIAPRPKPFWESKTVLSGLALLVLSVTFIIRSDPAILEMLTGIVGGTLGFGGVLYGRIKAERPLSGPSGGLLGVVFSALATITLGGCQTQQNITPDEIDSQSLGHSSTVIHDGGITAHTPDGTPTYSLIDGDGAEIFSAQPIAGLGLTLNGAYVNSPRNTRFDRGMMKLYDRETGDLVMELEFEGFDGNVAEAISARDAQIAALADYAKQLSADERDKFIRAMDTIDASLAAALKAALGVIDPLPD